MRVGDHLAGIAAGAEARADELVEPELVGPGDLDDAVHRRAHGDPAERAGDVIGRHGLDEHGRQPDRVAVGGVRGDAVEELEELRRADDRVRDRGLP